MTTILENLLTDVSPFAEAFSELYMHEQQFLRTRDLQQRYSVSRTTIANWRKSGLLPEPVAIGPNTKAWPAATIEEFEQRRAVLGRNE